MAGGDSQDINTLFEFNVSEPEKKERSGKLDLGYWTYHVYTKVCRSREGSTFDMSREATLVLDFDATCEHFSCFRRTLTLCLCASCGLFLLPLWIRMCVLGTWRHLAARTKGVHCAPQTKINENRAIERVITRTEPRGTIIGLKSVSGTRGVGLTAHLLCLDDIGNVQPKRACLCSKVQ